MQMRCVGKGIYHPGPGGIEKPGDFGWRLDADRYLPGVGLVPASIQIALHCPRTGVCFQYVRQGEPGDADGRRYWGWDGNWEQPTIKPSIGCDDLNTRCGQHMVISAGQISGNTPGQWVRRS